VNADVICLGSTGKGAVERVLLGSVSQSVVRASPIPVITVH
jgi:nucleotide-binding universal stress UspA family protein